MSSDYKPILYIIENNKSGTLTYVYRQTKLYSIGYTINQNGNKINFKEKNADIIEKYNRGDYEFTKGNSD
jgi:hypothetical protein